MKYFAYGSNMSHAQMQLRCPGSRFLGKAKLADYKLVFDGFVDKRKGAVANIIESPGSLVWGGLFDISTDDLASLDVHEGYRQKWYAREELEVLFGKDKVIATTYFRLGQKAGAPHVEYKNVIITGAKDCGLPNEYITEINFPKL